MKFKEWLKPKFRAFDIIVFILVVLIVLGVVLTAQYPAPPKKIPDSRYKLL